MSLRDNTTHENVRQPCEGFGTFARFGYAAPFSKEQTG